MKILIVVQGNYGRRIANNILKSAPKDWVINTVILPIELPAIIDDANDFLPKELPFTDLLISLGEHQGAAQMIPDIVERTGAKAVIAPADNRVWLPPGLARQIKNRLSTRGVEMVYPVPFCMISEKESHNEYIREFTRYFGRPVLDVNTDREKVKDIKIIREAPCGSTRYVQEHLPGTRIGEAVLEAGLQHHQYPCLATMVKDPEYDDTLMHRAGLALKQAVEESLKEKTNKRS